MAVTIESAATVGLPSSIGAFGTPRLGIVVHYPGAPTLTLGSHATCRQQARNWHNQHRRQGWAGLGYHYLICHHGIVMTGRGLNRVGAHAPGANSTHIGINIMVANNRDATTAQLRAFREFRVWLRARGVNVANVSPHSRWIATSCPGNILRGRIARNDWGSGGAVPPPSSPPEEVKRMPKERSLRRSGHRQEIKPKTWTEVDFTGGQYRTTGGWESGTGALKSVVIHGSGDSGVAQCLVALTVDGMQKGEEFQIRFFAVHQVGGAWTRLYTYNLDSPVHDAGGLHVKSYEMKRLAGNRRLRVEVQYHGEDPVYITDARTDAISHV